MKETRTMLMVIVIFILTWLSLALVGWLLSTPETTYKECLIHPGTLMIMIIFGWIPAAIVGHDYWEWLKD